MCVYVYVCVCILSSSINSPLAEPSFAVQYAWPCILYGFFFRLAFSSDQSVSDDGPDLPWSVYLCGVSVW